MMVKKKERNKNINGRFTCTLQDEKLKCERRKCHKTKFSFNRDVNFWLSRCMDLDVVTY